MNITYIGGYEHYLEEYGHHHQSISLLHSLDALHCHSLPRICCLRSRIIKILCNNFIRAYGIFFCIRRFNFALLFFLFLFVFVVDYVFVFFLFLVIVFCYCRGCGFCCLCFRCCICCWFFYISVYCCIFVIVINVVVVYLYNNTFIAGYILTPPFTVEVWHLPAYSVLTVEQTLQI